MDHGSKHHAEILVHIAAPSRRKDDELYRALVQAHLDFEPARRIDLSDDVHSREDTEDAAAHLESDEQAASQLRDELHSSLDSSRDNLVNHDVSFHELDAISHSNISQPQIQSRYGTRSTSRGIDIESPQASFQSILDNRDSPEIRLPKANSRSIMSNSSQEESWKPPPSTVDDSQPTYSRAVPDFTSPTRVLELYLQHFVSSAETPSPVRKNVTPTRLSPVQVIRSDSSPVSSSVNVSSPLGTSEIIPTSPVLEMEAQPTGTASTNYDVTSFFGSADIISASATNIQHTTSKGVTDKAPKRTPIQINGTSTPPSSTGSRSSPSDTGPSLKRKQPHGEAEPPPRTSSSPTRIEDSFMSPTLSSSPPPAAAARILSATNITISTRTTTNLTRNPKNRLPSSSSSSTTKTEIHPPLPATSTEDLTPTSPSILTPDLLTLAEQLSISKRYRPAVQTRLLRPLERGYWSLSVDFWTEQLRGKAWRFLQAYVGKGKAGWNVRVQKVCASGEAGLKRKGKGEEKVVEVDEEWRVYCWSDVVGHLYLLIYLASERMVKGQAIRWIDGAGEAVIVMPSE